MSKMTLKNEHYSIHDPSKVIDVTIKITEAGTLSEVIQTFEEFLRGSGYYFDGSRLELVKYDE